jgi:hypothetical protein
MVHPPSSVSSITSGSKSSGTPLGTSDLSGCLRSFFTCAPIRKYPLSQYRSWDVSRIVVSKLLGLRITSSRHEEPRFLRARILFPRHRDRMGAQAGQCPVIRALCGFVIKSMCTRRLSSTAYSYPYEPSTAILLQSQIMVAHLPGWSWCCLDSCDGACVRLPA